MAGFFLDVFPHLYNQNLYSMIQKKDLRAFRYKSTSISLFSPFQWINFFLEPSFFTCRRLQVYAPAEDHAPCFHLLQGDRNRIPRRPQVRLDFQRHPPPVVRPVLRVFRPAVWPLSGRVRGLPMVQERHQSLRYGKWSCKSTRDAWHVLPLLGRNVHLLEGVHSDGRDSWNVLPYACWGYRFGVPGKENYVLAMLFNFFSSLKYK